MRRVSITEEEIRGTPSLPWPTQVVRADGPEAHTSAIALEEPLSVEVNGQRVAVLMRLPGDEKEERTTADDLRGFHFSVRDRSLFSRECLSTAMACCRRCSRAEQRWLFFEHDKTSFSASLIFLARSS